MDSRDIWGQIKPTSIRSDYQDTYVLWLKDTFINSANYFQVNKNFNYTTNYDVLIMDYDASKKVVPTKRLVSWPYDTLQFTIGDYIHWSYGGVVTNWLIMACDKQYTYNFNGHIKQCKNNLIWLDANNNEITYPCVIDDSFTNVEFSFYKSMVISEGDIVVHVQSNADTSALVINDRFVFNDQSFMIKAINNFVTPGLITFVMRKDNIAYDDSTIADEYQNQYQVNINENNFTQVVGYTSTLTSIVTLNEEVVTKSVNWSSNNSKVTIDNLGNITLNSVGTSIITCEMADNPDIYDTITITIALVTPTLKVVEFSPEITSLKQGEIQTFTVYKYVDNVQVADTFNVVASGMSTKYYELISIDGNTFTIENIKSNSDANLTITCTSTVDATVGVLTLELKGFW